ncbi:hypothetical protein [Desulforamulus aeronauticus]|uniref:Uncharacterized protein n=1 Tax=Desulforamulus aeronauticus DSM 10349 TaxID=1121421 RepID=A0A1M6SRX1_9FIRM|nr:hypothetical protein [Desulforamulus aeronauticus]SHK47461.1 hypothetical protein SAMN02745123_01991 [Desulforamulus aeronauticus DSM 10349]
MGFGIGPRIGHPSKKLTKKPVEATPPVEKPVAVEEKVYRPPFSSIADIMKFFTGNKK